MTAPGAHAVTITSSSVFNGSISSTSGPINISATLGITAAISTTGTLTTSSGTGTTVTGTVSTFNATNTTSGAISLTNTATTLTVSGISESGGTVTVNNTGNIAATGTISDERWECGQPDRHRLALGIWRRFDQYLRNAHDELVGWHQPRLALNTIGSFHATNSTSGAVSLTNTSTTLTLTGITQSGTAAGSDVTINQTGNMSVTGAISTTAAADGNIGLTTTGGMTITAGVTAGGSGNLNSDRQPNRHDGGQFHRDRHQRASRSRARQATYWSKVPQVAAAVALA